MTNLKNAKRAIKIPVFIALPRTAVTRIHSTIVIAGKCEEPAKNEPPVTMSGVNANPMRNAERTGRLTSLANLKAARPAKSTHATCKIHGPNEPRYVDAARE